MMENILKDKRFSHLINDPKFRKITKNEYKVKIDKRFQGMFKDENFAVKYTVDKRGRPKYQSSTENLKKYYNISSSDEDSSEENLNVIKKVNMEKQKCLLNKEKLKKKNISNTISNKCKKNMKDSVLNNDKLFFLKNNKQNILDQYIINHENHEVLSNLENKKLKNIKAKLQRNVDYARGEGILLSSTSSDEENSDYSNEDEMINHNWGELDKETEITNDITHRLALCNMNWDRIRAVDLMVLFNSFLPNGGLLKSVTIYPSEFGWQRMKDEEIRGPIELIESNNEKFDEIDENDSENFKHHMEKLRQHQLNRLNYYYAVIDFDSPNTANKVYLECDGLEYESSSNKLDLRFIPDDMTFNQKPKECCNQLPDLTKYIPRQFTTTALQQVKVDLTWDETNPERQEITQKLLNGKLDDIDKNDIQAYLANESSDEEFGDKLMEHLNEVDNLTIYDNSLDKYKTMLKSIEQCEDKQNREIGLEFTWGLGVKENTENLSKKKLKENLTPFEKYLEKRKSKNITKKKEKNINLFKNNTKQSNNDSMSYGININKTFSIKEQFKYKKIKKECELELLLMDEHENNNKHNYNKERIEKPKIMNKLQKNCLTKRKKHLNKTNKDEFQINIKDPRFNALFTSHHYNIDPADSHYRKSKGTEALIEEKLKRRRKNDSNTEVVKESTINENKSDHSKINVELNTLIKSVKKNSHKLEKSRK